MIPKFFNNINLGITSKCNAKCAYCNRNTFKEFPDMNKDMELSTFKKIYPYAKRIEFCGSYGDIINHNNAFPFLELCKSNDVKFNIETNAGFRSSDYWKHLATLCNSNEQYAQFSIDDIINPINMYRRVKTDVVLNNLKTFIDAGGFAVVKTLLFRFNDDQQNIMSKVFKDLGVKNHIKQYSMIYEEGDLNCPIECKYTQGTLPYLYEISKNIKMPPKECQWGSGNWIYILDNGEVHPCCNIVTYAAEYKDDMPFIGEYTDKDEFGILYELYKANKELINLNNDCVTLETAYNNEYHAYIRANFKTIPRCIKRCGINNFTSNPITGII